MDEWPSSGGRAAACPRPFTLPLGRPLRRSGETDRPDPRQFAVVFARVAVGGMALLAATNWLANPWRLYSPRLLPPRVLDMRGEKVDLLRRARPLPEQLVLGSSRMLCFEPAVLERQTRLRTFNAAVTDAKPVDDLVLYRYAAETLAAPVRSVLLGVETHTFFNVAASYRAIETHPELRRYLPAANRPALSAATQLLSRAQAADSWASLQRAVEGQANAPRPFRLFSPDGHERWRQPDDLAPAQRAAFRERVGRELAERLILPGGIDPVGLRDLERLLSLLRRRNVRATVVATPMLASLREQWRRRDFLPNEEHALAETRRLCLACGARFVDFHRPESFGGDSAQFYDAVHPTTATTRRMIEALFAAPPSVTSRRSTPDT